MVNSRKAPAGISVIIPVYNREAFIAEAIDSILNQNYKGPLEVIVSDDGSTDRSLDIAASYGSKVKILRKPATCCSQGVSGARNRGINAATMPYIAFLDSDDYYLPDHLNKMVSLMEGESDLGFIFSRLIQMKEVNGTRMFSPWTKERISKKDIMHPAVSGSYVVHTNILLFKREVFEKSGVFNESYSNCEDVDLWMRISEEFHGLFSDHYGAVYRIEHSENQLTSPSNDENFRRCSARVFSNAMERYYKQEKKDRYRLFRLRLTLRCSSSKGGRLIELLALSVKHPYHVLCLLLNKVFPPSTSKVKDEWKDMPVFQ
ncbi:MAG: glycosyltransferase [Candidatus Electryonea clarkiae]|nr:glycosyltransferase [Candidatus Electryonea clarkiae]